MSNYHPTPPYWVTNEPPMKDSLDMRPYKPSPYMPFPAIRTSPDKRRNNEVDNLSHDHATRDEEGSRPSPSPIKPSHQTNIVPQELYLRRPMPGSPPSSMYDEATNTCFNEIVENMLDLRFIDAPKEDSGGVIEGLKPGTSNRVILRLLNSLLDRLKVRNLADHSSSLIHSDCQGPGQAVVLKLQADLAIVVTITEQRVIMTGFFPGYIFIPSQSAIAVGSRILLSRLVDDIWDTKIRDERLYDVLIHVLFASKLEGDYSCFKAIFDPFCNVLYQYSNLVVDCDEPFNIDWLHGTIPLEYKDDLLFVNLLDRKFSFTVNAELQHCESLTKGDVAHIDEFTVKEVAPIVMRGCYVGGNFILSSDLGTSISRENWNECGWAPWNGLRGFAIDAAASGGASPEDQLSSLAQALVTLSETAFLPVYLQQKNRLRDERVLYYNGDSWMISRLEGTMKLEGSMSAQLKVLQVGGNRSIETKRLTGTHRVRLVSQAVSHLVGSPFLGTAHRYRARVGLVKNPLSLSKPKDRAKVESATVFAVAMLRDQGTAVGGGACVLEDISSRMDQSINVDILCCQIARKLVDLDHGLIPVEFRKRACGVKDVKGVLLISKERVLVVGEDHDLANEVSRGNDIITSSSH